ncbi:MAG: hypothetical protein PHF67_03500 [Candidatus Nanoarchaeia archaeon]|nr:hypothetical protein [Candidatus Nanoarchaeia archaeon]
MKKIFSVLTMALLVLSVMPIVFAAGSSGSLGGSIGVEEFPPMVFQCGDRVLIDDDVQPWRITDRHTGNLPMLERNQQYLFEGERYQVDVLVFDKNKIQDDMVDLVLEGEERCSLTCGANNTCIRDCEQFDDVMINCVPTTCSTAQFASCNARIDEEQLTTCNPATMQMYTCTIDVLDSEHMYGLYWLKVRAESALTGEEGEYAEIARWFINPIISLSVDGDLDFSDVRPGTASYSNVLLENTAEGGVLLDMFITGKDWPSADAELGRCLLVESDGSPHLPATYVNYLPLGAFSYYTENGAYSTRDDLLNDNDDYGSAALERAFSFTDTNDDEGYLNIHRQVNAGFEEAMFDEAEIIQAEPNSIDLDDSGAVPCTSGHCVYPSNILYPGSAGMSVTFRLMLPEPCYGNFESESDGSIFFWGEAI